jgi:hypothetical protein
MRQGAGITRTDPGWAFRPARPAATGRPRPGARTVRVWPPAD